MDSSDPCQEVYRTADSVLIALNSMLRVRSGIDSVARREELNRYGFEPFWHQLQHLDKLNKQANVTRLTNLPKLVAMFRQSPSHQIYPRLLTRLNTAILNSGPQLPAEILFSTEKLQSEQSCGSTFEFLYNHNYHRIRKMYRQLYFMEMEATPKPKPERSTIGYLLGELKEVLEDSHNDNRIVAKDNMMFMHAMSDVRKHAGIVSQYYSTNTDVFSLDFDLTVGLAHNILGLEKDMMDRNALVKETIRSYGQAYRSHKSKMKIMRISMMRFSAQCSLPKRISNKTPEEPRSSNFYQYNCYTNNTFQTRQSVCSSASKFQPQPAQFQQQPPPSSPQKTSFRQVRQSVFSPVQVLNTAAQRVRTEFEPTVTNVAVRHKSTVLTEGQERITKMLKKRNSSKAIAGVLLEAKLPMEIGRQRNSKRISQRQEEIVVKRKGSKENSVINKDLERYLRKLKISLNKQHDHQNKPQKQNSHTSNSLLSTFVDISLSHTHKSSHHMLFKSDNPSAKRTLPTSTTDLKIASLSRPTRTPATRQNSDRKQDLFIAIKDGANLHNMQIGMGYEEFVRSELVYC